MDTPQGVATVATTPSTLDSTLSTAHCSGCLEEGGLAYALTAIILSTSSRLSKMAMALAMATTSFLGDPADRAASAVKSSRKALSR